MHYSSIPEKPLFAAVNKSNKILKKEKVYFFKREDGSIFATGPIEAWNLYTRRQQIVGQHSPRLELVGTGDGQIFLDALVAAQQETDVEKVKAIVRKGQEDEYEACKGKIIPPPNIDKMGDGANYI